MRPCTMRIRLLAVIGALVLVAGCTSGADDKATPKPLVSATVPAGPIDPTKATVLKPGEDLPTVASLPSEIGTERAVFRGFASANVLFGDLSLPAKSRASNTGGVTTQSHPMLYNRNSRSIERLDQGFTRPKKTQVLDMASVEANTVWVESPEAKVANGDIALYSYDRTSGFRRMLMGTPLPDSGVFYANDLAIVGSRVYFSMATIDNAVGQGAAIYSGDASGRGQVKVLVEDGQRLSIDGTKMTYFVGKKKFVRDLDSGDTDPAPVSSHASEATFCGAEFATAYKTVCEGGSVGETGIDDAVLAVTDPSGRATKIGPFSGTAPQVAGLLGSWLAFSSTDGDGASHEYLFELATHKLSVLPKGARFVHGLAPNLALLDVPDAAGTYHQSLVQLPAS